MQTKEISDNIMAQLGVNVYSNDRETLPENEEELSLHMQLEYKQSIEIAEEQAINTVFNSNNYDLIQRRINYDLAVIGIGCIKNEFNTSQGIKIKFVDPADVVYSYTYSPYFDDIYYIGEVKAMTINELKQQFPDLTDEELEELTDAMINKDLFGFIKKDCYIINTSRGEIVNENDVVEGLESGIITGYGTDVIENEFDDLTKSPIIKAMNKGKNIIVTPHIGGMTIEGQTKAYKWSINKL